jgi:hypothetical protein
VREFDRVPLLNTWSSSAECWSTDSCGVYLREDLSACCCSNSFVALSHRRGQSCASRPEHACRQYSRCNMLPMLTSFPPERKGRPKGRLIRTSEFGMLRRASGARACLAPGAHRESAPRHVIPAAAGLTSVCIPRWTERRTRPQCNRL